MGLIVLAVMTLPLVAANHVQTTSTPAGDPVKVTFDHVTGNEYWVQAKIFSSHEIGYANVRHESGQFQDFGRSGWDPNEYTIGMHVPPGERVQFQALVNGVGFVTSCFFTHPAGVEQCDPGSTDPFRATFRDTSGNEWWEQVFVDANRPIRYVTMEAWGVNGGTDFFLEKRSWGAYAGSYYQPSGSIVRFLVNSGDEFVESPCFKWPERVVTACPDDNPYAPMFDHRGGNEWWVEVDVGPGEADFVWARDDGGPWVQLSKRSWGVWANSFHIEPGHKVQFTAHVNGGRYDSCYFTHPQGMTPENDQSCHGGYVGPTNPYA
jgi:hypothetical protein